MRDITLSLAEGEVADILKVLGDLPTRTGAWPLMTKISAQAQACLAQEETIHADPDD